MNAGHFVTLWVLLLVFSDQVVADGTSLEEKLIQTMEEAEQNQLELHKSKGAAASPHKFSQPSSDMQKRISALLDQVEELKSQVVITKQRALHTVTPIARKHVGVVTVYPYEDGRSYVVHSGVGNITDVQLEPGEVLTSNPVAGDTVRWKIGLIVSGSQGRERQHVIVKPIESGIRTNLILSSDRRVYHLDLVSADSHMPSVRWTYPGQELALRTKRLKPREEKPRCELTYEGSKSYGYRIEPKRAVSWTPLVVFDDGYKTFIEMPQNLRALEAPGLWIIGDDSKPQLVNYRVRCGYYIVDRLFDRAELRVGEKDVVVLYGRDYKPSFWERLF